MEKELNYLSEKIDDVEIKINHLTSRMLMIKSDTVKISYNNEISKMENEKILLENILNCITISTLNL